MNNHIIKKFEDLCYIAKNIWENNTHGIRDLEPYLLDILKFTKNNLELKSKLAKSFIKIINDHRNGPLEIVMFAMRELRWEEVMMAALERKRTSTDPRVWTGMNDVLDVYEDDWEDADMYEYYSKANIR